MATTNLISKSLGDIFTQTGNGTPDHTSPQGSIYVDQDTGIVYLNLNSSTTWIKLNSVAYGDAFYNNNTTATTIGATNTWTSVNNTFTAGTNLGFSVSTNTLVLSSGYDGIYEVKGDVTIAFVTGTNNYEVGLSVNGANPTTGTYGGALIDTTYTRQHIGFTAIVTLTGGDTLRFAVRNLTAAQNVIIRNAQLFARKIG